MTSQARLLSMTKNVEELVERARALPRDQQAELASELLALLDEGRDDAEVGEREWADELGRRAQRVISGESRGTPWPELRARILAGLRRA